MPTIRMYDKEVRFEVKFYSKSMIAAHICTSIDYMCIKCQEKDCVRTKFYLSMSLFGRKCRVNILMWYIIFSGWFFAVELIARQFAKKKTENNRMIERENVHGFLCLIKIHIHKILIRTHIKSDHTDSWRIRAVLSFAFIC